MTDRIQKERKNMNIKEWLKVDEDRVICELETLFMHLNVPAGDIGKLRNAVDKLCVSSGAPEETDYVVKVHCKNGKKTFDVYERAGQKMILRWRELSEAGLSDLPQMI